MGEPAVEVTDLVVRFGTVRAVDGLSMTVERGKVAALLGPNGAGKTTTVETCEGYRRPTAGQVRVLGLDPIADSAKLRPRLGVMLQSGGVPLAARPLELLRQYAAFAAWPIDPDELLTRLGLRAVQRTPYRRLSGGERQRLSLALALVGRPELVVLDEPTAGLDPQARLATWELLRELRADGVTVVLCTHAMDEAERLADHVIILDGGRVVAAGSPAALTADGADDVVRFRGPSGLDVDGLLMALPEGSRVAELSHGAYRLEGTVDPQVLATLTAWCAQHGFLAQDLAVQRRTLEDVFLDLTGRKLRS